MNFAELSRRIENLIRFGTIAEIDHGARRVRVQSGKLLTEWLKWQTDRAGSTRSWNPPTLGEQVMILSPSGELGNGIVLPSIYSDTFDSVSSDPTLHIVEYPDGARIAYNHATGALSSTGIKTALVQASDSVTLDTPMTHITGNVQVDGDVHVNGDTSIDGNLSYGNGLSGTGGSNGNVIAGSLTQTGGQLSSNGIVLDTHTHSGVQLGSGNTGAPQ